MRNTASFIKQWSKKRKKGKTKYILINSALYCAVYWIVTILLFFIKDKELHRLIDNCDVFIICILIYIISLFIVWEKNENKYNNIINN